MTKQPPPASSQVKAGSTGGTPSSANTLSLSASTDNIVSTTFNPSQASMSPQYSRPQGLHQRRPSEHFEDRVEALRHDVPEERWNIAMPGGSGETATKDSQSSHDRSTTSPTIHPYTYLQPAPSPPSPPKLERGPSSLGTPPQTNVELS